MPITSTRSSSNRSSHSKRHTVAQATSTLHRPDLLLLPSGLPALEPLPKVNIPEQATSSSLVNITLNPLPARRNRKCTAVPRRRCL
jgi:hypothetical protein